MGRAFRRPTRAMELEGSAIRLNAIPRRLRQGVGQAVLAGAHGMCYRRGNRGRAAAIVPRPPLHGQGFHSLGKCQ